MINVEMDEECIPVVSLSGKIKDLEFDFHELSENVSNVEQDITKIIELMETFEYTTINNFKNDKDMLNGDIHQET